MDGAAGRRWRFARIIGAKNFPCDARGGGADTFHGRETRKTVSFVPLQQFPPCGCSSVDRVLASEAKGRGFDPRQPHQQIVGLPTIFMFLGKIFSLFGENITPKTYTQLHHKGVAMKSSTKKVESNIYVETRGKAMRFVVAVYPLPKDSATFSDHASGLQWARRRRVELLEQKAGVRSATLPDAGSFKPQALYRPGVGQLVLDPSTVSMSSILDHFRKHELIKLTGKDAESSRLKQLHEWFGHFLLGQLNSPVVSSWQEQRRSGLLGSGRNPNRSKASSNEKDDEQQMAGANALPAATGTKVLTKHQRHALKKKGGALPGAQVFPVSTQTVRHELMLLRRAIQVYFTDHMLMLAYGPWLQTLFIMSMKLPKQAEARTRRISDLEIRAIIAELSTETQKTAVLFALLTSLRCSELVSLRWEDLKLQAKTIVLREPGHLKESKTHEREVPLLPLAIEVLKRIGIKARGHIFPISASGLSQAWRRAADRAGAYDARLHDCRRESISRLVESCKLGVEQVIIFSGHSDITTLQKHYLHLEAGRIAHDLSELASASSMLPTM
jgi:integrase